MTDPEMTPELAAEIREGLEAVARGDLVDLGDYSQYADDDEGVTDTPDDTTPTGIGLITAERRRQVEAEDYTAEHDSHHWRADLAKAAAVYALSSYFPPEHGRPKWTIEDYWPKGWAFKPAGRVRMLVKAGALIAAEVDRLLAKGDVDDRR